MSLAKLAHPFTGSLLLWAWRLAGRLRREPEFDQHGPVAGRLDGPPVLDLGDRSIRSDGSAEPSADCKCEARAAQTPAFTSASDAIRIGIDYASLFRHSAIVPLRPETTLLGLAPAHLAPHRPSLSSGASSPRDRTMMTSHPRPGERRNRMPPIVAQVIKVAAVAALTFIAEELLSEME